MSQDNHAHPPAEVPAELIARHRAGWNSFTGWTLGACLHIAALLLLMLIFLRIL